MTTPSHPLVELYQSAIYLTNSSIAHIKNDELFLAEELLKNRTSLLKKIQRTISHAPAWGTDSQLDQLGIDYIIADQQLQNVIDFV